MSIRELFAVILIMAGIWLNLMLQDSMAEGAGIDWQVQQLQDRLPTLLLTRVHQPPPTRRAGAASENSDGPAAEPASRRDDVVPVGPQRGDTGAESYDDSDCD